MQQSPTASVTSAVNTQTQGPTWACAALEVPETKDPECSIKIHMQQTKHTCTQTCLWLITNILAQTASTSKLTVQHKYARIRRASGMKDCDIAQVFEMHFKQPNECVSWHKATVPPVTNVLFRGEERELWVP